jgi:hypothetical protein
MINATENAEPDTIYLAQLAKSAESIAASLREIADSSKTTAAILNKIDQKGLPPSFIEMTEAWKKRWLLD